MRVNWEQATVYLATEPVDMRKQMNGLCVLVSDVFQKSPQACGVYVFYNRQKDKVKCLWWDNGGFVLYYKRLEQGRYKIPKSLPQESVILTDEQLDWLLAGVDFYLMKLSPKFTDYF